MFAVTLFLTGLTPDAVVVRACVRALRFLIAATFVFVVTAATIDVVVVVVVVVVATIDVVIK